ncbi:MAG: DUF1294 domain-containing protein [Planctomycetaceae bacterium]|jgi:uncharacterized membrane protein YsdA (DUF1294 family)|nr:DUF1294 domain-containing protein [Planctomycetaceae bacterium]
MSLDPWFAIALFLVVNLVAFAAQGIDKVLAVRGARRISERTLLSLGLPLAAPGMWLGMRTFRHKTRKVSFLVLAVLVTLVNLGLLAGFLYGLHTGWLDIKSVP